MQIEWQEKGMDGGLLYSILNRHQLLPAGLADPGVCIVAAQEMTIGILHDGKDKPLAVLLESYPEPGVIGLLFITEVAHLNTQRDELIEVSLSLRDRWFNQMGAIRVESRIPVERTQTVRCLKHFGFKLETEQKGLRNAVVFNGAVKSLHILGLLSTDPAHVPTAHLKVEAKELIIDEGAPA